MDNMPNYRKQIVTELSDIPNVKIREFTRIDNEERMEQERNESDRNENPELVTGENATPNPLGVPPTNNPVTPSTNPDWKNLVVGSEQCKVDEVEKCLRNSASASVLWERLADVGRTLGFPRSNKSWGLLTMGLKSDSAVLVEILEYWHAKETVNATLGKLDEVLRRYNLNDCAETLARTFQ
ncbi:unnamed protein product [Orchesella dallaii]|uniref:Death domain-containing protein n=1 Tax=Orchesella dallaii TaxID=48710 RepID=A0ABP1R9U4_9HEXA